MKTIARIIEKGIIYILIFMMSVVLILATIELGYYLFLNIWRSDFLLIDLDDLLELFGVFLLVLIGIELLDTVKVYLKHNQVHVEVVVLVAIIALARKIVILNIEELSGETIIGLGILIISLSLGYYFIKKAGLAVYTIDEDKEQKDEKQEIAKK